MNEDPIGCSLVISYFNLVPVGIVFKFYWHNKRSRPTAWTLQNVMWVLLAVVLGRERIAVVAISVWVGNVCAIVAMSIVIIRTRAIFWALDF